MKKIMLLLFVLLPTIAVAQTAEECFEKGKKSYESKDYAEAYKWFKKAADQGNAKGQNGLGLLYEDGNGVTKDINEAVKWYRKSAEQGYAIAQNNLGYLYFNGRGVDKDYAEAQKWIRKAADKGNRGAKAQRFQPDPKRLVTMMLEEKDSGKIDDLPYVAYLDSLGFTQMKDEDVFRREPALAFEKKLQRCTVQVRLSQRYSDSDESRHIQIQSTSHTLIWWVVVQLKDFGLKQTEGEGDFIDLKGMGLYAGTGSGRGKFAGNLHSITIGCTGKNKKIQWNNSMQNK